MLRKANAGDRSVVTGILARSFEDNLSVNYITAGSSQGKRLTALMEYAFEVCSLFGQDDIIADKSFTDQSPSERDFYQNDTEFLTH